MNNCICCHDHLLRHINHHRVYWFCPTCYQEMPSIDASMLDYHLKRLDVKFQKKSILSNIK
jgi:hypothetical protein